MSYDLGTAHGKIVLDYNGDKAVDSAERDIDRLSKKSKEGDKHLGKMGKTLGALGKGVALTGLVASLTNAAFQAAALGIQLAGTIPALASITSLSAGIPGLFIGAIAAVGTLKAAFVGVGDAVKEAFSDDPAKFEEALKKLSPEAQKFAKALKGFAPILKEAQQGIQDAFFSNNFQDLFPRIKTAVVQLQPSLAGLAQQFGDIARSIAEFAISARTIEFVQGAVDHFRAAIDNISPSIAPVLVGLRAVGTVGLPLMDRLGVAVGRVAQQFGDWLSAIAADGRLQAWIETALQTLSELGQIISNVGAILNAVFKAAQATGGGLLGTLAEITGEARRFLESAEGSAAITELFAGILSVARQLAPIFTTLVGVLADALGPALKDIAVGVGPELLKVVQALAPAFGPLAKAIADIAVALAPLLPPIAELVSLLVQQLATGLSVLAAELTPVLSLLGGVMLQAFQKLAPLVAGLAEKVLPLAAAFGQDLLTAVAPLAPVILELADAFVNALGPVMPQIMENAQKVIPALVELATVLSGALAQGLTAIIPLIPPLVNSIVAMNSASATLITFLLRLAAGSIATGQAIATGIGAAIAWFVRLPAAVGGALTTAYNWIVGVGASIVAWFSSLGPKIGAVLTVLPGIIAGSFKRALELAASALGFGIGLLVGIAVRLPARIAQAIAALPGAIGRIISQAWHAARDLFNSGVSSATNTAQTLPRRVASAIQGLISAIGTVARNAWNNLRSAFSSGVNNAVSVARSLPGRAKSALGNVGNLLYSAGVSIINGLIRGISSGISRVMGMISGLASRVKGAFSSALSIFSPSKVFFRFGVNIDQGLINGIKSKLKEVVKAGIVLSQAVIRPSIVAGRGALPYSPAQTLARISPNSNEAGIERPQNFGPYELTLDGGVVTSFVIDTITGNPTVVSKASSEGARTSSFAGSGRATANA